MRIGGASSKYPDLIQVPGAIYVYDFVAFTKDLADGAGCQRQRLGDGELRRSLLCSKT